MESLTAGHNGGETEDLEMGTKCHHGWCSNACWRRRWEGKEELGDGDPSEAHCGFTNLAESYRIN